MVISGSQASVAIALFSQLPSVISPLLQSMVSGAGVNENTGATSSPSMMRSAITVVVLPQSSVAVHVTVVIDGVQRSILNAV